MTDATPGPERSVALAESVTLAFMVLLETLSPEERAVFLLREVFEHDYDQIAAMLDTTAANCRQLFHRAKEHIAERRPRFRNAAEEKRPLVGRFVNALIDGNAEALTSVLAEDVGFWSDGGGKVLAARRPVFGRETASLSVKREALAPQNDSKVTPDRSSSTRTSSREYAGRSPRPSTSMLANT